MSCLVVASVVVAMCAQSTCQTKVADLGDQSVSQQDITSCQVTMYHLSLTHTLLPTIIIITKFYLLKSTRQEDAHMINSKTRKAQKTGAYILPIKNKHTRYKNN